MRRTALSSLLATVCIPAAVLVAGTASAQAATVTTGSVTGTVVNEATGKGLSGVCVNVVDAGDNQTVGTSVATGSTGVWKLKNIPVSTTYTAIAFGCENPNFVGQWYDGQDFQDQATQFTVAAGKTTKAIDYALSKGGSISGTVTDAHTKAPVAGILVVANWTTRVGASTFAECTSSSGTYKLQGVPTSGAKVEFLPNDCGVTSTYAVAWYKNQTSYDTAAVVTVTAGTTTKNINQTVKVAAPQG